MLDQGNVNFEVRVDAHRRESPTQGEASNEVMGRATLGWRHVAVVLCVSLPGAFGKFRIDVDGVVIRVEVGVELDLADFMGVAAGGDWRPVGSYVVGPRVGFSASVYVRRRLA